MKTKYCPDCGFEKPIDDFALNHGTIKKFCRYHTYERAKKYTVLKKTPNNYINDEERNNVYLILQVMGWTFNKEKQIWYKEGLKDENGIWKFQQ